MPTTRVASKQQILITDNLHMQSKQITNLADGVALTDAVNLGQLQAFSAGQNTKASVRLATTGAETYTIVGGAVTTINGTTIDGVAVNTTFTTGNGDRIVIKNAPSATGAGLGAGTAETTNIANGIYRVTAVGANISVERAPDMDNWAEVTAAYTWVEEGTTQSDTAWIVDSNRGTGLTINGAGATIHWVLYASATAFIAGAGLIKTGNTIDVASTTLSVTASAVDLASIGQTDSTSNGTSISFVISQSVDSYGRTTGTTSGSIRLATTALTGIASFDPGDFAVSGAGAVTIKALGVDNAQLANSSITLGATAISLGGTTGVSGTPISNLWLTTPNIPTIVNGAVTITMPGATTILVGRDTTDTLTNKSISGATNTLTNIPNSALTNSAINFTAGTGITLSASAASLGGTALTITNAGVISLTGTANRVTVSAATGAITLNGPQDIHTGAIPTFAGLTINAGTDTVGVTNFTSSETWNNAAVSFLSSAINITDTASAVASRFIEYSVGGSPKFSVRKDGAITTGIWNGTTVASGFGGTGFSTYTQGDIIWASATNTLSKLAIGGTIGHSLTITAAGTIGWAVTDLSNTGKTSVAGTLAVGNGGTGGNTAPTAGQVLVASSTSVYTPRTIASGTGVTVTSNASGITIAADTSVVLTASNFVPFEIPTSQTQAGVPTAINGTTVTDFVIANTPITGAGGVSTLQVYLNGVRMQGSSNDYAMFNATTIRFQSGAIPQPGDVVSVMYFK